MVGEPRSTEPGSVKAKVTPRWSLWKSSTMVACG